MAAPLMNFDVGATVGALEIGTLVAVALFGATCIQTILYFTRFPSDPLVLKFLASIVWFLDFNHTLCITHALYQVTIVQYGHPELLDYLPSSLNLAGLLSGFVGPIEQAWFAYRVYKFSKSPYLPLVCATLSATRLTLSCTVGLSVLSMGSSESSPLSMAEFNLRWGWLVEAVLLIGAATDLLLVAGMCWYLGRWKGEGFRRMNQLVSRLMYWSVETGLLTSIGALFLLITFLTMKQNFVWVGMSVIMCKLFSNSLLFSLNSRRRSLHGSPPADFYTHEQHDSIFSSIHSPAPLTTEFKISDVLYPALSHSRGLALGDRCTILPAVAASTDSVTQPLLSSVSCQYRVSGAVPSTTGEALHRWHTH